MIIYGMFESVHMAASGVDKVSMRAQTLILVKKMVGLLFLYPQSDKCKINSHSQKYK